MWHMKIRANRSITRTNLLSLARLVLVAEIFCLSLCAQDYRFDGRVTYTGFADGGTNPSVGIERDFWVLVTETNWAIKTISVLPEASRSGVIYDYASSNGKEVFAVKKFTPQDVGTGLSNSLRIIEKQIAFYPSNSEPWKRVRADKARVLDQMQMAIGRSQVPANDGVGVLLQGGVPEFNSGLIAPLWLGLVSERYFVGVENGYYPAVWTPRGASRNPVPQAPARYERSGKYPNLLSWARFFESEDARDKGLRESTTGVYTASKWRTNSGVVYPEKFLLTVFGANGEDAVVLKIEATITSMTVAPDFTTVDSGVTNIALRDERFKNDRDGGGALVYLTGGLVATNAANTNREYYQQAKDARLLAEPQRRWPIFAVGAMLVAAPIALICFKRFRR